MKTKIIKRSLGPKRDVGQQFEIIALNFLTEKGLRLVTKNFNCKTGEIDLVMYHDKTVVFVEVRYRKNTSFMSAAETINFFKQQKLIRTAELFLAYYTQKYNLTNFFYSRFDVVTIEGVSPDLKISWIKNAF